MEENEAQRRFMSRIQAADAFFFLRLSSFTDDKLEEKVSHQEGATPRSFGLSKLVLHIIFPCYFPRASLSDGNQDSVILAGASMLAL